MDLSAAFAELAAIASAQFDGSPFYPARVIRYTTAITDDGGSIIVPSQPTYRTCQVQVDAATEAMRSQDGYADKDMRILILSGSLAPIAETDFSDDSEFSDGSDFADTSAVIDTDMLVEVLAGPNMGVWSVQSVGADPAGIGFEVRGRQG